MRKIVIAGLFIFVFLFGLTKIEDYDLWWHLKTGQYILAEKKIPTEDIFSFTNPSGTEWVVPGWMSGIIFYLVEQVSGFNGLIIFKALIISLAYLLLLLLFEKKKKPFFLTILVLIISVLISRFRFIGIRPYIFKYVLSVFFIYLLESRRMSLRDEDYRVSGRKKVLYLFPLLMVLWTNLHGTFFLGLVIIAAYILGEYFEKYFSADRPISLKPLILLLVTCALVTLLNPYGYRFHQWTFKLFLLTSGQVIPNQEFMPPRINEYPLFWFFLFSGMLSFLLRMFIPLKSDLSWKKKIDFTYLFLFLPFAYLAFKSIRYIAIFSLVNSLILVENFSFFGEYCRGLITKFDFFSRFISGKIASAVLKSSLLILMAVVFFYTFRQEKSYRFGLGIKEGVYPIKAAEFIENEKVNANNPSGNIYNSEEYGGYLIWKWFPKRKVFIFNDNLLFYGLRNQVYGKAIPGEDLLAKYGVNCILKSYSAANLENYYLNSGNWKLVWWDEQALIYLKDIPENKDLILKYAYKYVDPLNFNLPFAQALVNHNFSDDALEELNRNLGVNPDNFKTRLFLGYLYESLGENEKAIDSYLAVKKIQPGAGYIHYQIGLHLGRLYLEKNPHQAIAELSLQKKYLPENAELEFYLGTANYFLGRHKLAAKEFTRSLELNPMNVVAQSNLGFIYHDMGRYREAIREFKKAVEINPNYPDPYFGLASLYEKLIEKDGAIKNWEKYLALGKDPRWIAKAQESLEILRPGGK